MIILNFFQIKMRYHRTLMLLKIGKMNAIFNKGLYYFEIMRWMKKVNVLIKKFVN